MNLSMIKKGSRVKVVKIASELIKDQESKNAIFRVIELGLVPGAILSIKQTGPILFDPIAFELNGCSIALSRHECQFIEVEEA